MAWVITYKNKLTGEVEQHIASTKQEGNDWLNYNSLNIARIDDVEEIDDAEISFSQQ